MAIVDRPYAGNWQPNLRQVIQYTPDMLVYLNGDTSMPGCQTCRHNIDLQEFVTSVSVDCGTEPGASNASISLSIPRFYGDSLFRDGNTILKTALEVHLYARGYFPMKGLATPSAKVGNVALSDIPQYPYYPVFHGVVTSVSHEYSGGYYSATITCNGMLHFWQHMKLASSGSYFGSRPNNSGVRTTLRGHPFSGMTPYAIIYNLFRDTAGAAAGVGFALQSRTNFRATSSTTRDSIFSLAMRYWERRFRDRAYGLRMHGASGQMFTASQQAYISQFRTSSAAGRFITANLEQRTGGRNPLAQDQALLLGLRSESDGRVLRQPDLGLLPSANGGGFGLNVTAMQAFVTDISTFGQVNFFESTYESKLDVATQVTGITGYEFYQDVDGDLVFKPPLYNLDTSSSRVYRIEPIDIISINFTESEPEATYVIVKGGPFANMRGVVDEAEWGMRSVYVDYKGVAQYGWREHSIETSYYSNARSAFFAGVAQLDRINAAANSCSITIPMRAELRPGYPVYIPNIDCFYYIQSLSHAFSFGGQCTTTLNLVARRRKFLPPGSASVDAGAHGVSTVDLANTSLPPKALQALTPDGVPRLIGFPNVVMALDPTNINPLFFVYGFQAEETVLTTGNTEQIARNRQLFLSSFIHVLVDRNILGLSSSVPATSNPLEGPWTIQTDENSEITFTRADLLQTLGNFISFRTAARTAIPTLREEYTRLAAARYTLDRKASRTADEETRLTRTIPDRMRQIENDISTLQANFGTRSEQVNGQGTQGFGTLSQSQASIQASQTAIQTANEHDPHHHRNPAAHHPRGRNQTRHGASRNRSELLGVLAWLINQARPQTQGPGMQDQSYDPTGTVNESATILELLNDRKASMSINTPGYYRYYSSSHPNPNQQGYSPIGTSAGSSSPVPNRRSRATIQATQRRSARVARGTTPTQQLVPGAAPGTRLVVRVQTVVTPPEAVANLAAAWERQRGSPPSDQVLSVLVAQWAYETRRGERMFNFNYGGIKAFGDSYYYNTATHENLSTGRTAVRRNFHAYATSQTGADGYVAQLLDTRYRGAVNALEASNSDRAAADYVAGIHTAGYFADARARTVEGRASDARSLRDYQAGVTRYARTAIDQWIPAAHRAGLIQTHGEALPEPPESVPGGAAEASTPPQQEDIRCVQVVNATNVRGTTTDAQRDLVSLTVGTPVNGLLVRTSLSQNPVSVPTSQIFTLTFEERGVPTSSTHSTVVMQDGESLATATQQFQACRVNPPQAESLARVFMAKLGPASRNAQDLLGSQILTSALAGITDLKGHDGTVIATTLHIANGVPNTTAFLRGENVTSLRVQGEQNIQALLLEKARGLIVDVTLQNQTALDMITAGQRSNPSAPPNLEPLRHWTEDIVKLFSGRTVPPSVPFHTLFDTVSTPDTERSKTFSPVFPVSDAKGYEHFGAYQYGRGLSIEPGGNYERLMALDPFQYMDPERVDAFVRAIRATHLSTDSQGRPVLNEEVRAVLNTFAGDIDFQNSVGGQIALQWAENGGGSGGNDRTSMIAAGLANFVMSDRDAVTKLPVSNAAFNLTDLAPMGQHDTCSCRGAEADLLLAAYMAGVNSQTFVSVDAPDQASEWSANQMSQAAESWMRTQQALRGQVMDRGQRSLLSQVSGWETLVGGAASGVENLGQELGRAVDSAGNRLSTGASQVRTNFNGV